MTLIDVRPRTAPGSSDLSPARRTLRRVGPPQLWWLTPAGIVLLVVPLSLLVALQIPDADYRFFFKAPRVIDVASGELFLAAAAVLVLGTLCATAVSRSTRPVRWPGLDAPQLALLGRAETLAFRLTVLGYVLFAALGVARGATPAMLIDAVTSQDNYTGVLKTVFAPVAGVTSLTQVGIAEVVLAGILLCHGRSATLTRRLVVVVLLGLIRSYLLTERLALLELVVPLVAIGATRLRLRRRPRRLLQFAPLFALPLLVVIFGAFEYSRSWVFYRAHTTLTFPRFVINRLAGYYATSYNNGALQLVHSPPAGRLPYDSIQAFWTAPGVAQLNLYGRLTGGQNGADYLNGLLVHYANPEFNNPGGLATPLVDFGPTGGLVFFFLAGLLIGLVYCLWRSANVYGLLIYPVVFTGLLELPRYLYWTEGRVFPAAVFLLVAAALTKRVSAPKLRARSGVPRPVASRAAIAAGGERT